MLFEIDVLKNFANFTGKHLCWSLFFNFIKKRLQHRCLLVKLAEFFRTPFSPVAASVFSKTILKFPSINFRGSYILKTF